ncbi:putative transcription factor MADS-type1 family [Medicago truncatula]|uniref:MADS-box transcription factor family protein n=1 Tax=Medicago truncatula TaxID=3880 RepID=G7KHI2_MEDTR|nr:agamous-like MADS-box protein AGL17 [Medicago truncatula]AES74394.1 MADS-box transcription factor family protein [Medicago truncatula]RHN49742.1 putative transcription factor MADS-type1 family [Medicago truncatula]
MGRGRISMELIQKERSRKITLQKRKDGLIKKAKEFSILCDVDVCLILYAPNLEGQGYIEPETWPKDKREVQRVLQKYYETTIDRRPKTYDVQEYFKERMKKVELEIYKVRKERLKMKYPTWDESYNSFGNEQLRSFVRFLDSKLDACDQKMNMRKDESYKVNNLISSPYLTSNSGTNFNLMHTNISQVKIYSPLMNICDKNPLGFWPIRLGQSSQHSLMVSSAQSSYYYPSKHIDANVTYDSKISMKKKDEVKNDKNLPSYYYNGNAMIMQSYPIAMPTPPFQNLANLSHEYLLYGSYDIDSIQAQLFNSKNGTK